MNVQQLILEAIIVGSVVVGIGVVLERLLKRMKYYNFHLFLFLIGIIAHFGFEYIGLNKFYCKHGYACKKKN